ncbi:MAG: family 78 glycoside hydrolase catalytic domain, partial [Planctomycetota bacterium]|nr:family 78 glycoside hydrolase catalytic domain [Planctomycetota bacterium]
MMKTSFLINQSNESKGKLQMKHLFHRVAACLLAASASLSSIPSTQAADVPDVTNLRCEYRGNPLGIDATQPRLSWVIDSARRGERQTAYQLLVASSEALLKKDKGDLWDSGKVESDQSIHVEYAGKPLRCSQQCFWKVRVWTTASLGGSRFTVHGSEWSKPASWTMGLLSPSDWKAKWIKPDVVADKGMHAFDNCAWILFQSSASADQIPQGNAYFRARMTLPEGVGIRHAFATMTADNGFTLFVNGQEALKGGDYHNPYQSGDVARLLKAGENFVTVVANNTVLGYAGLIGRLKVELDDGRQVTLETGASWKAADREQTGWQQAGFDDTGWPRAREIGKYGAEPWNLLFRELPQSSAPWVRKVFTLAAAPKRALAYVNVKGYHELWVNGKKAGDAVLTPAVSVLKKRFFYVTYDVSPMLRQGRNTIGLWLGRGWNAKGIPGVTDEHPLARVQMDCVSGNETIQIASDETWLCSQSPYTTLGPWMWNNYGGEGYDARLENLKWCDPNMDESGWKKVEVVPAPDGRTESQAAPLNRRGEKIAAVKVRELGAGKYEVDFGKNLAGWVNVKMPQLKEGAEVALLFNDGYTTYNQESRFISAGKPGEFFENKFNYAGFRYLTIEGLPSAPEGLPSAPVPGDVTAYLVESDLEETGSFECSNELFNRIHRLNLWTLRCLNLGGYLVDCPHRERLGYGDGQVSVETCIMNWRMPNLYEKWLRDWVDTQNPVTGALPFATPYHEPAGTNNFGREGPPGWGGAMPAIAWRT